MNHLSVLLCLAAVSGAAQAALSPDVQAKIRAQFAADVPGLIARYQLADALFREGIGRSDAKTSGGLGWGESGYLRRYMMCYFVTHDTYWLDKVISHFDRMIANLSDPDGDGFLSWRDVHYSVGLVDVVPQGDVGALRVVTPNGDRRVYVGRGGEKVTGHTYRLEFTSSGEFRFIDTTVDQRLGVVAYHDPTMFDLLPGTKLKVSGPGRKGAVFLVKTTAPQPCEYQVHDGMVTYPVAQLIVQIRKRKDLPARYQRKAEAYLALLHQHFIRRWEKTWVDVPPDAGLYAFTKNPTQRFPGYSLPHNQYLAPGRTCLTLARLKGYEGARLCADRARKMATYFKRHLRLTDEGAYVWNYWDPLPTENVGSHIEDCSHGTIDIGFAISAAHHHVVFTREDLHRFARTYVDVMWNGDRENPRFGARVDTKKGGKVVWWEWIRLAQADPAIWDLALAMFRHNRRPTSMIPALVALYDELVGVDETTAETCRANTARIVELTRTTGLLNPGFELSLCSADTPAGWTLGTWTPDAGSETEWTRDAHQGKRALALTGKQAPVNVWARCDKALRVSPPAKIRISAFYKAGAGAQPGFSVIAVDATGARVQYKSSPRFPRTTEWKEAAWSTELDPKARSVTLMLRNHGPGRVVWDDVRAKIEKP